MHAKIKRTIPAGRLGNFGEPGARDHDGAAVNGAGAVQVQVGLIGTMAHANVVHV